MLSPKEFYSDWTSSYDTSKDLTRLLDYYKNVGSSTTLKDDVIKKFGNEDSTWWTRISRSSSASAFYYVGSTGSSNGYSANGVHGVSPAFRLG